MSVHGTLAALRAAVALAALGVAPGCSYLFVDGPPPGHEQMQYFDCTTSRAAPIADTVFAALYGLSALAPAAESGLREDQGLVIAALAGVALFEAGSAAHGFGRTSKCEAAKKQMAGRRTTQPRGTCGKDLDCKGDRVCEAGLCVQPPPRTAQEAQ